MRKLMVWISALLAMALVGAACGSDEDPIEAVDATEAPDDTAADDSAAGLASCPNPLVIQTDWFPEPEHGAVYNLTAGEGSIDPETGRFSGPLAADPSITIEIRAGGPYIGFQPPGTLAATDDDIFLSFGSSDTAIVGYDDLPSTAVMATLDINPQMIMWDPETYAVSSWDDVAATGATINVFAGGSYQEFLIDVGLVDEAQIDPSYDGAPTRFIAEGGAIMQQGFVTQEPFQYESVFADWGKPVESLLVHDAGFEIYTGALTILDRRLDDAARDCLSAFVPLAQQSLVDFMADPGPTNAAILQAVIDLDSFWQLSEESVARTVEIMASENIVSNGHNSTAGDFDLDRVEGVLDVIRESVPSLSPGDDLTAADLYTNEFIDESIGF